MSERALQTLTAIAHIAGHSTSSEEEAAVINGATHPKSIEMIAALANAALEAERQDASPILKAGMALESPAPQSSVQIEGRAKGPPAITVKVYAADIWQARQSAIQAYDATAKAYADPEAKP